MKICNSCEKKWIENEIHIIFRCNKYDNILRKAFSDINEVDNIKLQIWNKVEKQKLFFAEGSLNILTILDESLWIYVASSANKTNLGTRNGFKK